ncbi:hypothetical protein F4808DRAFT_113763 [Astrocystis sublimbata]|nr:hypothetical protein F4808DRAFT_113763 [Astrocystis sublimbata]
MHVVGLYPQDCAASHDNDSTDDDNDGDDASTRNRLPTTEGQRLLTSKTTANMKPVVGAMQAWSCVVISAFAIIVLSVIGGLYRSNHHELVGSIGDPETSPKHEAGTVNTAEVSSTIFTAVVVYAAFLVCCGFQGVLHMRESRRGAIQCDVFSLRSNIRQALRKSCQILLGNMYAMTSGAPQR